MTPSKCIHPYGIDYPKCVFSARSSAYGMSYPTNYSTYRMLFFSLCVSLKGGNRKNDGLKLKSFRCYKRLSSVYSHSKKDKLSVSMSSVGLSTYLCTPTSPIGIHAVSTRTQMELKMLTFLWMHHNSKSKSRRSSIQYECRVTQTHRHTHTHTHGYSTW